MEINVYDNKKYVSIWLTRSESRDDALRESLKPIYQKYKAMDYTVAVFESGSGDLPTLTKGLLSYNHLLLARKEVGADD